MDVMQILFLALLFLAVFGLVFFALSQFLANPVRDRLEVIAGGAALGLTVEALVSLVTSGDRPACGTPRRGR